MWDQKLLRLNMVIIVIHMAILFGAATAQDGLFCDTKHDIPYLNERVAGYNRSDSEQAITDFYLNTDWYSMPGFTLSSDPIQKCGAHNFWYMKDKTLPDNGDILNTTVCFSDGSACMYSKMIRVKRCSVDDYRFFLERTDASDEAYCTTVLNTTKIVDPAPNVTYITPPKIEVRTIEFPIAVQPYREFELEFLCNFTVTSNNTLLLYTVEWSITDTSGKVKHLQTTTSNKSSDEQFIDQTKLSESTLRSNGIYKLGFRAQCTVRAKSAVDGEYSPTMSSQSKYFGIEILSEKEIRLEGNKKVTISVRLTVPFRCKNPLCFYDLLLLVPKNHDSCQTQSIRTYDIDNTKICGTRFNETDVDTIKTITIANYHGQATNYIIGNVYNVIFRTRFLFGHKFFTDYVPDPIRVYSEVNYRTVSNAWCYSHSDPYIQPFDGNHAFPNQVDGAFLLYRNLDYNVEIHTKQTSCWDETAYCNIAVAIRVGKDVYVIDLEKSQTAFTRCEDGVLAGKIHRIGHYNYRILLPTGAEVTIEAWSYLEIDIKPGLRDYNKTDGLCGRFDGNPANDGDKPENCTETQNLCWKRADNESLFNNSFVQSLQGWSEKLNLCRCNCTYPNCPLSDTVECGPDSSEWCSIDKMYFTVNHEYCFTSRRKRYADIHRHHEFMMDSVQSNDKKIVERRLREVTFEQMDFNTAKMNCIREMNTTSVQICSELPGLDVESYYEDCARDLVVTNSYEWVQQHIEGLKKKCLHFIEVRQPLPQYVLENVNLVQNDNASGTNDNSVFDSKLLERLKNVSCPNDCSKHGECINGKCQCKFEYINEDCSILYTEPPVMIGIPDNGLCDLAERPCEQTMVIARNFVESENLTCKLTPLKVDQGNKLQKGNPYIQRAKMDTFLQVMCPLTQTPGRKKRFDQFDISTVSVGYLISLSNNREIFSKDDSIVIFDSICLSCTKQGGTIECQQKLGYCVHEGRCYTEGDVLDCYRCHGTPLAWSPGKDCRRDGDEDASNGKLWIIGPVAAVLLVAAVIGLICHRRICQKCMVKADQVRPSGDIPANADFNAAIRRHPSTLSKEGSFGLIQIEAKHNPTYNVCANHMPA